MKRSPSTLPFLFAATFAVAAHGGGVSPLGFESAESLGMGGAGSAVGGRLGNAAVNPAALTYVPSPTLAVGASVLWANGRFDGASSAQDAELDEQILPLPHLQYAHPLGGGFVFGIAVAAPEAHSATWNWNGNDAGDALVEETTLAIGAATPSLAWKANERLSVAAAPQFFYCVTHEVDALDRGARGRRQWLGTEGDGSGLGALLGAHYVLAPEWTMAGRFATGAKIDMEYDDRGIVEPAAGTVADDLRTPLQLGVGLATTALEGWTFALDLLWSDWDRLDGGAGSRFQDDTLALALGAEKRISATWTLRGGYRFEEGRSYEGSFLVPAAPAGDQHVFSVGTGYSADGRSGVDLALAQSRGEDVQSQIDGLDGRFIDFQRWTGAVTGWWRF